MTAADANNIADNRHGSGPFLVTNRLILSIAVPMTLGFLTTPSARPCRYGGCRSTGQGRASGRPCDRRHPVRSDFHHLQFPALGNDRTGGAGLWPRRQAGGAGRILAVADHRVGCRCDTCRLLAAAPVRRALAHGAGTRGGSDHGYVLPVPHPCRAGGARQLRDPRLRAGARSGHDRPFAADADQRYQHRPVDLSRIAPRLGCHGRGAGNGHRRGRRCHHRLCHRCAALRSRGVAHLGHRVRARAPEAPVRAQSRHHDPLLCASGGLHR